MSNPRHRGERPLLRTVTLITEETRNATKFRELAVIMTWCDVGKYDSKPPGSVAFRCCSAAQPEYSSSSVRDQIVDFLDGKTHGEAVLRALYDHVLDEPIPERMRALFRK